jgi:predicted small metal-binding protein
MAKVAEHVRQKHNVKVTTGTIAAYVKQKIKRT